MEPVTLCVAGFLRFVGFFFIWFFLSFCLGIHAVFIRPIPGTHPSGARQNPALVKNRSSRFFRSQSLALRITFANSSKGESAAGTTPTAARRTLRSARRPWRSGLLLK